MRSMIRNTVVFAVVTLCSSYGPYCNAKSTCEMPCMNGGTCKRRRRQTSELQYGNSNIRLEKEIQTNRQYCVCPTGYVGSFCEIKLVLCNNGNETCTNGDTCKRGVDNSNKEYYHCACDMEESDLSLAYARKFCEHESTVFCISDIDAKNIKKNRQSIGGASRSSFCTNGGTCKDILENGIIVNTKCTCPDGYSGQHCEVSSNKPDLTKKSILQVPATKPHRNIVVTVFVFFVCFFTIIAVSLTLLIWYGNRNRIPRKPRSAQERAKIPKQVELTEVE